MKSIKDIYKIGKGPSSSHTMGPAKAMGIFVSENPDADSYEVILYGSLCDTGKGHGTDKAIESMCGEKNVNIINNNNTTEFKPKSQFETIKEEFKKQEETPPLYTNRLKDINIMTSNPNHPNSRNKKVNKHSKNKIQKHA